MSTNRHSDGPYARVGARLVERGYAAIPIMPGTKRPGHRLGGEWVGMSDWQSRYTVRLPTTFEIDVWSRMSDAGVCVVAGEASQWLIVIDIDTDDPKIIAVILAVLPHTDVRKRGAKGESLFFRGRNIPSRSFSALDADGKIKARLVDIIGPGRQTVLPPSIHPDTGSPYRWTGLAALEDTDPRDLPELPDDIGDKLAKALEPFGWRPEPARLLQARHDDSDNPHRALNDAAMTRLDAWVPRLGLYKCRPARGGYEAIASWRASTSGKPLEKRKLNLKIHPTGIRDMGDRSFTPIDLVMAACGCGLEDAFLWLSDALGRIPEPIVLKPKTLVLDGDTIDAETGEVLNVAAQPVPATVETNREKREDGIVIPGLVGEIIDWITATSRRPNRTLALGAALTIVGTLIGRRVATPTRAATHLYAVTLAPTGSGKQHALNCVTRLMKAAGAGHHIGPSQFISMSAVLNFLMRMPLSICAQDEFGAFLKRIGNKRASTHEQGISMVLRSMWGTSFESASTPEWAGRAAQTISAPALSIYGISTQDEFYEGLQGGDVTGGFLNRFLVLSSQVRAKDVTPALEPGKVPEMLSAGLASLYNWSGSTLALAQLINPSFDPDPDVLPWASAAAQKAYADFVGHVEDKMAADREVEPYLARTAEIAIRVATIVAAGRWGRGATVGLDDFQWAADLTLKSSEALAREASMHISENDRQLWSNKVMRLIERRGNVTLRDIQMSIRGALKSSDLKDILASLVEAERIELIDLTDPASDTRKRLGYRSIYRV